MRCLGAIGKPLRAVVTVPEIFARETRIVAGAQEGAWSAVKRPQMR